MTARLLRRGLRVGVLAAAMLLACEGPVGPKGDPGETGPPGEVPDVGVVPDSGALDASDAGDIPIEPEGLVGVVADTAAWPVAGGRVVLVSASDVEALAATAIDLFLPPGEAAASTVDEPIEDLLDAAPGYPEAITDAAGVYRFATLPDEPVFVVFVPAATDDQHLPGGSYARVAQDRASLVGGRLDLRVSTTPSPAARHVGSTPCLTCHGRHRAFGTAHFAGLSVPGVRGAQQDTSRWPEFDAIFERFGATLYFYDCDGVSPGPGRCKVSETAPAGPTVSFVAELTMDASVPPGGPGRYSVTLRNVRDVGAASYDVDLSYGGALYRNQLLVSIPGADGRRVRYALPFQYQQRGDDSRADPDAWTWRDVGSSDWYDHDAGALRAPATESSFDNQCAGCHFTGFELEGDASDGFHATAVSSPEGTYDYDGDGRRDQINVGCESCHGPGSEHLEAPMRGEAIVSPDLLLPGRALAICGSCHSRPEGIGGAASGAPLDAEGRMPRPGIRRAELIANHFARSEAATDDFHPSGDAREHRLQYTDHVRSAKYRNGSALVTCTGCHDAHGRDDTAHDLYFAVRDNAACTGCHSGAEFTTQLRDHVETGTGNRHEGLEDAQVLCTLCHFAPTAVGGSVTEGLFDGDPATSQPVQYFEGDIATHRYRTSGLDRASEQPATVTQRCGICHRTVLPNPP